MAMDSVRGVTDGENTKKTQGRPSAWWWWWWWCSCCRHASSGMRPAVPTGQIRDFAFLRTKRNDAVVDPRAQAVRPTEPTTSVVRRTDRRTGC